MRVRAQFCWTSSVADAVSLIRTLSKKKKKHLTKSLELRQAQLHNEPAVQHRERDILLRLGNEAQRHFGSQEPTWFTSKIKSFQKEQLKHISFVINGIGAKVTFEDNRSSLTGWRLCFARRHNISTRAITDPSRLHSSLRKKLVY